MVTTQNLIQGRRLERGDQVRIIAPSSSFDRQAFDTGIDYLKRVGLRTVYDEGIFNAKRYLAGDDDHRLQQLHEAFADTESKAIFCARGGYGSTRLLARLDKQLIRQNPKILVGCSDITALHAYLVFSCGLTSLHGPHVAGPLSQGMGKLATKILWELLMEAKPCAIPLDGEALTQGQSEGLLFGGNLALLQTLVGLPTMPSFDDSILFFEEVNEPPYRIDRMLTHLRDLGCFTKLRGLVVGKLGTKDPAWEKEIISEFFGALDIPIFYGAGIGHHSPYLPIPVGVKARLDTVAGSLEVDSLVS